MGQKFWMFSRYSLLIAMKKREARNRELPACNSEKLCEGLCKLGVVVEFCCPQLLRKIGQIFLHGLATAESADRPEAFTRFCRKGRVVDLAILSDRLERAEIQKGDRREGLLGLAEFLRSSGGQKKAVGGPACESHVTLVGGEVEDAPQALLMWCQCTFDLLTVGHGSRPFLGVTGLL